MKKLVVIGGGFAGSYISRKLENYFDLTIIDTKDYFEFTPGILRTIVEYNHIEKVQIPHKDYLKKSKIIIGHVKKISKDYVLVNNKKIKYDYLAICSGSSYSLPIKEQNILVASRAVHLKDYHKKLFKSRKILIVGGGLVGVELASEIITHYKDKEVTIIHSEDKLIERNNIKSIKYVEEFLKKNGVNIIKNERITKFLKEKFISNKGSEFTFDIAFLCTGIKNNIDFMKKDFNKNLNKSNQVIVNEYLQVNEYDNIFAAGDITSLLEEKTAQNAKRQAKIVVNNLLSIEKKEKLKKYAIKKTPLVISLGKYNGVIETSKFIITGIIPAILKYLIEKIEMKKLKLNKLF